MSTHPSESLAPFSKSLKFLPEEFGKKEHPEPEHFHKHDCGDLNKHLTHCFYFSNSQDSLHRVSRSSFSSDPG